MKNADFSCFRLLLDPALLVRVGDEFFEAIDLTTSQVPEPGSFFLLGTGALTILGAIRRR